MIPKLSTHVLDTALGKPAQGVKISVFRDGEEILRAITNADGRCDAPLLEGASMFDGRCEIRFEIGDYYRANGVDSGFLDVVPVWFQLASDASYHVPLVCTPWAYSTYRGS